MMRVLIVTLTVVATMLGLGQSSFKGVQAAQSQDPPMIGTSGLITFLVQRVFPHSPAEQAGIKPGDLIVELNGEEFLSMDDVWQAINGSAGKPVEITYLRYNVTTGQTDQTKVTLQPLPYDKWKASKAAE